MGKKSFGIDNERLNEYAQQIKEIHDSGVEVAIVIGGGNIFRGVQAEEGGMDRTVIKAGTRLELLPSSALERMTADRKTRTTATYRLWNGRVTKYKGRNYIFPNFFLYIRITNRLSLSYRI